MKRPAFWLLLGLLSIAAGLVGYHYFPQAFSIVSLDITMDREHALEQARGIMTRDRLGPADYRQAASFGLDEETQTFVELEGGGKEAFTRMMRDGLYAAYTWRVRHFAEGHVNETTIRFTPDGHPCGFVERLDGKRSGRRAASRGGESHRRGGGARELAGGRRELRARRAGSGAATGRRAWTTPSRASVPRRRSGKGDTGCNWSSRAIG